MKSVVCTLLLFVATVALGQQQPVPGTPPFNPNPQSRGNNAPPNEQSPAEQMPPDTKAPAHVSNSDIERQLQNAFDQEPVLTGTHLKATADDDAVTISGTVENEQQHKIALEMTQGKAGERKIVDKIVVRKQTSQNRVIV